MLSPLPIQSEEAVRICVDMRFLHVIVSMCFGCFAKRQMIFGYLSKTPNLSRDMYSTEEKGSQWNTQSQH